MRQMLDSAGAGNRYREGAYTITRGMLQYLLFSGSFIFWHSVGTCTLDPINVQDLWIELYLDIKYL